jgi:hypothetical protein
MRDDIKKSEVCREDKACRCCNASRFAPFSQHQQEAEAPKNHSCDGDLKERSDLKRAQKVSAGQTGNDGHRKKQNSSEAA